MGVVGHTKTFVVEEKFAVMVIRADGITEKIIPEF